MNQSLPGFLPLLFLLKCIILIIGSKDWVLLHELKECIQHLIRELNVGHLWSLHSSSFGGLGGALGGGISWLAPGCSSVTSVSSETSTSLSCGSSCVAGAWDSSVLFLLPLLYLPWVIFRELLSHTGISTSIFTSLSTNIHK